MDSDREVARVRPEWAKVCLTAFSPNRRHLATWSVADAETGELALWNLNTGRVEVLTKLAPGPLGYPQNLIFSPQGTRLACISGAWPTNGQGEGQGKIVVWGVQDPLRAVPEKPINLNMSRTSLGDRATAVFSPDGTLLAATPDGRTITLWELTTGKERVALRGHAGNVVQLTFSPDGRRLLSAGYKANRLTGAPGVQEQEALEGKLWDLITGQEVLSLPVNLPVHFDGQRIVTPWGGRLRVFDGTPLP